MKTVMWYWQQPSGMFLSDYGCYNDAADEFMLPQASGQTGIKM